MVKLVKQNYDENKRLYNIELKKLRDKIDNNIPIDHVGSTAIPDMYGKNIIDILVGVKDQKEFEILYKKIVNLGFFAGEKGKTEIYQFFASNRGETASGDVHIHLVIIGTDRYNEFLWLRDYLLSSPDEAKAYSDLKLKLIHDGIVERKDYKRVKSEYVTELIKRAREYHDRLK